MKLVFGAAVRWTVYVEKLYEGVDDLTRMANITLDGIPAKDHPRVMASRTGARESLKAIREVLLLDEPPEASHG